MSAADKAKGKDKGKERGVRDNWKLGHSKSHRFFIYDIPLLNWSHVVVITVRWMT
jgi:hypothetical protein